MKIERLIISVVSTFLILGGLLIFLVQIKATGKTIEEAIEKTDRQVVQIIHQEKVKEGEVVFYYKGINNGKSYTMASGYIKRTLGGWKWVTGGEHSVNGQPITVQYFPLTKEAPFPLAFGKINNSEIAKVRVQTEKVTSYKETRIVKNGSTRIWFVFLKPSEGVLTKVVGQSSEGEIVASCYEYKTN